MTAETGRNTSGPRFGVWANVYGTWASAHHPEDPVDASWERNREQILLAERLGYDSTLIAQHLVNPHSADWDQLETWTATAALAATTTSIELIAAIKPLLFHPVVLAKQAATIEEISRGRLSLNVVNAWFRPEIEQAGIVFPEHDSRYAYGAEWLQVVRRLLSGEVVDHHGRYFDVDGYQLHPTGRFRTRPQLYVGGESDPAKDLVADQGDVWFINGQPLDNVRRLIADVARRPRVGAPVRYGLAAFVIARPDEAAAEAELRRHWALKELDEPYAERVIAGADQQAVMFATFAKYPAIGTNGGTAAGLVGSYDQVAERIVEFHRAGIETFMLQFQPFEAEMERFAAEVIPRVRSLLTTDGAEAVGVAGALGA
ncbi:LLM class flavin-dependent oxidoreductase [Gordonia sp. ABSL1-1]|uniref:LLM class flavin-dependent oxidoreductase n=1 Tax=Gordonia sp. ABSL1-1 TaxID=3053923 RepID=UPI002573A43E|nr:LLM class flavin-dependent oxidoreductase [Gordonia sp. ABSL1-1]MDL9936864.1 LLM class flavin-dependent oxidoreductase [Gordonia sp. ABSL1-1]